MSDFMKQHVLLTLEELLPLLEAALDAYHEPTCETNLLESLRLFRGKRQGNQHTVRQALNEMLYEAWLALEKVNPQAALLLHKRFFDCESMTNIAHQMHLSEGYVYVKRKQALEQLTNLLLAQEQHARNAFRSVWAKRLQDATHHQLLGIDEQLTALAPVLLSTEAPWLMVIEGIGGIGKTALADALCRQVMEHFWYDDMAWISLKSSHLTPQGVPTALDNPDGSQAQIAQTLVDQLIPEFPLSPSANIGQLLALLDERLKGRPHLLVIDNIESAAEIEVLLPLLVRWLNPTRVILTSRVRIPTVHAAYRHLIPALTAADALRLVRQEAQRGNLPEVANRSDAELMPIYQTVGGNPLALRLVVGLAHNQPLAHVLKALQEAPTARIEELYRYIFWQAWGVLDDLSRQVLLYMPLANSSGDPLTIMADALPLTRAQVQNGLDRLADANLVNVHRSVDEYRYSIHSLTRTFLLNDALGW